MVNRILLCMSASLAVVMLATTSPGATPAAGQCLAKPKGPPPSGQHWYYRTNRSTNRKCWFLADQGIKVVSTKRRKAAAPEDSADQDQKASVRKPIANAHAELISEPEVEPAPPAAQSPETQQATEKSELQEAQVSAPADTKASDWAFASRWPDPSIAYGVASRRTALVNDPMPVAFVPAVRAEEDPLPVLAASTVVPVGEPSVAAADAGDSRLGQLAAAFLVVVAGAAMMLFFASRRRSIAPLPAAQSRPSINRRPRF